MLSREHGCGERHSVLEDLKLISVGQRGSCLGSCLSKAGQLPFSGALPALGLQGVFTLCLCAVLPLSQMLCCWKVCRSLVF